MRDLIEKLQQIEEGAFKELQMELDNFEARKPDAAPEEVVAHIRKVMGDDAAEYVAKHVVDLQEGEEGQECKWWAMCDNPATTTEPHPILGDVPICDRCAAKLRKIEGLDENYEEERSYDDFVDYYVQDLSSSIVRKGVFQDLYKAAGNDIDVLNAAIKDEAYSIADSYYGTGEGIGTSDMNHFIQGIGKQLGVDDLFGWYKKKEEGVEEGLRDKVVKGFDKIAAKIHDDPEADVFGFMKPITKARHDRLDSIKSDDEMERDAVNRYNKYNTAIRNRDGLSEDAGHSIFEILADSDVYHLVDDLEYGRFDNNSSYADILYDYYNDEMPYDVATGDYGEPDEWIKDKLMQDYGDEIDDIAQKMASEQLAAIRKNAGLGEAIVKVPRGLRYDDVVSNQDFGMSSDDAEAFINSLGPDDTVSHEVVDPETGELLDWPDRETRRKRNQKEYDRQEKERKEREEKDHEEGYDSPYLYVSGLDKDPENAWEGIQTLKYDREFTDFYNIVWRSVREYAGEPEDLGADTQDWADLDYDVDIDIPVAIKRKDGKKFNKQDRQNFDWISKIFKAATGNIGVHYIGSSDNGTVARFNPTFM